MSHFSTKKVLIALTSLTGLTFIGLIFAVAPNPGHTWSELGDVLVTVAQGGTGLSSLAAGGILYSSATDTLSRIAPSAANQVLRSTGANALQFAALVAADLPSFDVAKITSGILSSVYGGTGNGFTKFSGPTTSEKTFTLPDVSSTILTSNAAVTVGQGGTGLGTLTLNNVILGNGTSTPLFVAPGANGNVLTSNGTTWTSAAPSGGGGGSNTLLDGTNHTDTLAGTVARGDVIVGNATPQWSRLAKGTQGQVLSMNRDATDVEWNYPSRMYATKREMLIFKNGGVATVSSVGILAPTLTATASNADDATGTFLNSATSTTSGNASGIISAFAVLRRDWEPEYLTRIKTDATAVTLLRYWIGFFSASPDASAAPNIHAAAFRYDTAVDGTAFWRTVTIAGTGASATVTTTTTAIAANTEYELYINCGAGATDCKFYINDVLVATHTTTLPTTTQSMGYGNRVTTLTTAAKNLKTQSIYIRHNH